MSAQLGAAGVDLGAMEEAPLEEALEEHVDGKVPAAAEVPAAVDAEVPAAAEVPAEVDALVAEAPVEAVAETEAKD
jgi:small subunit ribosomal protein S2